MEDLPMGVTKTFFIGGLLTDLHSESTQEEQVLRRSTLEAT